MLSVLGKQFSVQKWVEAISLMHSDSIAFAFASAYAYADAFRFCLRPKSYY